MVVSWLVMVSCIPADTMGFNICCDRIVSACIHLTSGKSKNLVTLVDVAILALKRNVEKIMKKL